MLHYVRMRRMSFHKTNYVSGHSKTNLKFFENKIKQLIKFIFKEGGQPPVTLLSPSS